MVRPVDRVLKVPRISSGEVTWAVPMVRPVDRVLKVKHPVHVRHRGVRSHGQTRG